MGKQMFKGALLAGAVGAGAMAVKAYKRDEPVDVIASQALKKGAQAAAAGAVMGMFLDRRTKRRNRRTASLLAKASSAVSMIELAKTVRPAVDHALEAMAQAADAAKPKVEQATERTKDAARVAGYVARPRVEHAAEIAKSKAMVAKPKVEHAAEAARHRAGEAIHNARERADEAKKLGNGHGPSPRRLVRIRH